MDTMTRRAGPRTASKTTRSSLAITRATQKCAMLGREGLEAATETFAATTTTRTDTLAGWVIATIIATPTERATSWRIGTLCPDASDATAERISSESLAAI